MERCSDARPYWCEACDKGFRYLNTYNRHLNRYHPARHEAVSGSDYDPTQDDMDISADSGTSDEEHTELYGSMDTCSNTADDGVRANAFENHSERTRSPIALRARLANIQHNCQESDTDDGDESNTAEEDEMQCDPLPPPEPEDGDSFDQHQDGTAMRPRQMLESRLLDFLEPQPLHFEQPTIALDIEGFLHDAKFASINEIIGPFKSVRDVNMAHMALAVLDLGEKQVDDLMRGIADDSTIGSAKRHGWSTMAELKTLIRQSHFHDPFTLTDVHIIHSTSTFPHRRIIPTIERLFKSTKFLLKFTTTPRGVRYGDEPVYLDPAAGIAWQAHHDDLMKQVGPFDEEGVPNMLLPIGFYSDKSNISANQDAHPLFVFLAGVHPDILSKPSYRAMRLLAMFPIPTDAALQGLSVSKMVRMGLCRIAFMLFSLVLF
ncbi:hypothetical protein BCR44DRAFT_1433150 [Catenaria anguillulae PL171]|uniref:C2H2-type domain-containing protein n=1 Tax=Catenaria anguillulae PL171 TaxID=765915 RepID=A0A1Y2HNZ2_9FUNG|nr:hypothetical protein BCR44DRAFT_1433150 [Catenaria anguillulae PL171]